MNIADQLREYSQTDALAACKIFCDQSQLLWLDLVSTDPNRPSEMYCSLHTIYTQVQIVALEEKN